MFPVQSSFIPVTVALSRYIAEYGFFGLYPYWYLGSTPVKYLIGPIVPVILDTTNKLTGLGLFNLSLLFVVFSIVLSACGWGIFTGHISGKSKVGIIVGILGLLLPWHWYNSFALGEVSAIFAIALTPYVLFIYSKYIANKYDAKSLAIGAVSLLIILLVNSTAALVSILAILIIAIVVEKPLETGLKKVLLIIFTSWILSIFWYGVGYYLAILGSPSIGGGSLLSVFKTLADFLRTIVPIVLAIVFFWWKLKPQTRLAKFCLLWLVIFGSLTLFRFMADWDFWMDWTAWLWEIEVGLVLLIASLVEKHNWRVNLQS